MAIWRFPNGGGADMRELRNERDFELGEITSASAKRIVLTDDDGERTLFTGQFRFSGDDISGTLTGVQRIEGAGTVLTVNRLSASAATVQDILESNNNGRLVSLLAGDDDQIIGTRFDDVLLGFGGDDALRGKGGDDMLIAAAGDDRLFGAGGQDTMKGGGGDDLLNGGAAADRLLGNAGADTLDGGGGNDVLNGGGGADEFRFTRSSGDDTVQGFQDGSDLLFFRGAGSFAAFTVDDTANGALISFGRASVLLQGVDANQIDENDFLF